MGGIVLFFPCPRPLFRNSLSPACLLFCARGACLRAQWAGAPRRAASRRGDLDRPVAHLGGLRDADTCAPGESFAIRQQARVVLRVAPLAADGPRSVITTVIAITIRHRERSRTAPPSIASLPSTHRLTFQNSLTT
ncbi:Protein of unknown function [Gryllus bimaculatus]|nr:Protein of unknown function [Gryllus bimaculatus]